MIWEPLSNPVLFQLTMTLVHFVWQGALVWLIWVAVMRCSARPETRYHAGVVALGVMLACPIVTACVMPQRWQEDALKQVGATSIATEIKDETGLLSGAVLAEKVTGTTLDTTNTEQSLGVLLVQRFQPVLLLAWLLGVGLLGGRLVIAYIATVWLRCEGKRLELSIQTIADQISRRLGFLITPPIGVSSQIGEALTVGVLQPMVLLPTAWLTDLTPEVLEAVIAHELAHVRRADLWINAAQRVVETLLFYHPAVWFISRQVRVEREFCCDELAILATGRRVQYAQSLEFVARRQMNQSAAAFAAPFLGDRTMTLLKRVRHALGIPLGRESGRLLPIGLALLIVPAGLWVASAMLASPRLMAEDETAPHRDRDFGPRPHREGDFGPRPRRDGDFGPPPRREGDFGPPPRREGDFGPPRDEMIQMLREDMQMLRVHMDRIQRRLDQLQGPPRHEGPRDGDRPRHEGPRDGDRPRHEGPRDGDRPRPEGPRDGDRPRAEGPRDGDRPRPEGPRDGDRPRPEGPRDGDRPRPEGPRDGDRPRPEGPRDGDAAPAPKLDAE